MAGSSAEEDEEEGVPLGATFDYLLTMQLRTLTEEKVR